MGSVRVFLERTELIPSLVSIDWWKELFDDYFSFRENCVTRKGKRLGRD